MAKNKKYTPRFKTSILDKINHGHSVASICAANNLHPSVVYGWKAQAQKQTGKKPATPSKISVPDAIVYLRKAREAATASVGKDPTRWQDPVYHLALMALHALGGM